MIGLPTALITILLAVGISVVRSLPHAMPLARMPSLI
jgi:hypothetical protein